jgi:hypothetical protein
VKLDDVNIPAGWTLEPNGREPQYAILSTPAPCSYFTTIDFTARGFRNGGSYSGLFVGEEWGKRHLRKKYEGRGWKQALVNDAIKHLQALL